MKRLMIVSMTMLLLCGSALAQPPDTLWTKTYGGSSTDEGWWVEQTSDGGFILSGYSKPLGCLYGGVYLVKTDQNGNAEWEHIFTTSPDNYDAGRCVKETSDGCYIVSGYTSIGWQTPDVWLLKINSNGDTVWTKTFGGPDSDYGYAVQQTVDSGYIIGGKYGPSGESDVYLVKTDSNGNLLWECMYGGSGEDQGRSAYQTLDEGYIVAGFTDSYGAGSDDGYLIKTDANGDTVWTRTFGGSSSDNFYEGRQTQDGGYICTGETSSYGVGTDVYLVKTDADGDTIWTQTYGGSGFDVGHSVQQTQDGGYIIAGYTSSFGPGSTLDVYLVKTDASGNMEWQMTIGGTSYDDYGRHVAQCADEGYVIVGRTGGYPDYDVYLTRVGSAGEPIEITMTPHNPPVQIPSGGGSFNFDLEIANNSSTLYTINVGLDVTLTGGGIYPVLLRSGINLGAGVSIVREDLTQFVPAGVPEGTYQYNGYAYDPATWEVLAEDHFEFEKLAGDGAPAHNQGWALYGWDSETVLSMATINEFEFRRAHPNPFNPATTISFTLPQAERINLTVYNTAGALVATLVDGYRDAGIHEVTFDALNLPSGVYFARLHAGGAQHTQKLLLVK